MLTRRPYLTAATAIFVIGLAGPTPGLAASEKGPTRCSDGEDNDVDGKIDCEDPDCKCGGGNDGDNQATIPSIVTFRDRVDDPGGLPDDGLQSDGDLFATGPDYTDGETHDLWVGIGSRAANEGNILMGFGPDENFPAIIARGLKLDFSNPEVAGDSANCPLLLDPSGLEFIVPHFLKVTVTDFTHGGVLALENVGDPSFANMRFRFFDPITEDPYFLYFKTRSGKSPCQGQWDSVLVVRTSAVAQGGDKDVWTVTVHDDPLALACLEKSSTGRGTKAKFCGTYNLPSSFTVEPCLTCP